MEQQPNDYEPGLDQNQGVVGTMARNQVDSDHDTELVGSRLYRLDPNIMNDQSGAAIEDDDERLADTNDMGERQYVNDDGEAEVPDPDAPTGQHDHQQDDNYGLGGHVTRSGA